jgi:hypothetical protein
MVVAVDHGYEVLASAIAGRRVGVGVATGQSYSDGQAIFLASDGMDEGRLLIALVVQASLLPTGSLDPRVVGRLVGHPSAALRYFSLETARSVSAVQHRLPGWVSEAIAAHRIEQLPESPAESLDRAFGDDPIPAPPDYFGTLRPKAVAGGFLGRTAAPTRRDRRAGANSGRAEAEPEEQEDDDQEHQDFKLLKLLSSPLSSSVAVTLLQRLFGGGRRPGGQSSSGGAEVPVTGLVAVDHAGPKAQHVPGSVSDLKVDRRGVQIDAVYPEWNHDARRYRPEWCWVTEYDAPAHGPEQSVTRDCDRELQRRLARLGLMLERHRRQFEGDMLDLDPLVDIAVARALGDLGDDRIYQSRRKTGHDLAVFILLDASGSGGEKQPGGLRTYDLHRQVAATLATAFEDIGDRVALFGFNSRGRRAVQFQRVKDFDERFDRCTLGRLSSLEPAGYTRLGAAVRHATRYVAKNGGASNRLVILVSDGFPFDEGYEGPYAEHDARRALDEARQQGVGTVALSIAPSTRDSTLERVFGASAFVRSVDSADLMARVDGALRSALRVAAAAPRLFGAVEI